MQLLVVVLVVAVSVDGALGSSSCLLFLESVPYQTSNGRHSTLEHLNKEEEEEQQQQQQEVVVCIRN